MGASIATAMLAVAMQCLATEIAINNKIFTKGVDILLFNKYIFIHECLIILIYKLKY